MAGKEARQKTSVYIRKSLWQDWGVWVIRNYGSSRKMSEALEDAMIAFMKEGKEKP